jgi:CheY-like chemotaxis protein
MEVTMPGKRLLLVEDEFLIRTFVAEGLSEEGFEVIEAANGVEAVQTPERLDRLDLVLTDLIPVL